MSAFVESLPISLHGYLTNPFSLLFQDILDSWRTLYVFAISVGFKKKEPIPIHISTMLLSVADAFYSLVEYKSKVEHVMLSAI
jgi:hypothetical protein